MLYLDILSLVKTLKLPTTSLLFNPVKLGLLIGWIYLCLYCAQLIEFSSVAPKKHKNLINVAVVFFGPIIYLVLLFKDISIQKGFEGLSYLEKCKGVFEKLTENFKGMHFLGGKSSQAITLVDSRGKSLAELYSQAGDKQVIRNTLSITEELIVKAITEGSSDILIDPKDNNNYVVRFRIDGVLRKVHDLDAELASAIVNSIKAVSGMDIAERRRPQDGAFTARRPEGNVSFRVASAGVLNGEKLAIRVLNQETGMKSLADIGVNEKQFTVIQSVVSRPSGMILVCGPTGSGKTTTLYGMLSCIDFLQRNVITVEDPIEYLLPNASQMEVNAKADITFAKALRSMLRQDPDVICVGEIRDEETAATALQAAQTGHLVIATIHSNNNISSIVRLLDLKVSPLLISAALSLIVSQRLVRVLCPHCKKPIEPTNPQMEVFRKNNLDTRNVFVPVGCEACSGQGYKGRVGIFDVLELDSVLKSKISDGTFSMVELTKLAESRGASNLRKEGIRKVLTGVTTLDEVRRVTTESGV
jgi:general secretion pathway protein E